MFRLSAPPRSSAGHGRVQDHPCALVPGFGTLKPINPKRLGSVGVSGLGLFGAFRVLGFSRAEAFRV